MKDNIIQAKTIELKNGELETPFFMPDATRGFVKFLSNDDVLQTNTDAMVVNTYHLLLRPGIKTIKNAKGIHKFMNWRQPLLSDSGGFQVFSLIHKNSQMGKITAEKVVFRSPLDGSKHILTPEKSIQIQFDLGVDMMVCLDDPPPNHYSKKQIEQAVGRTVVWAERCLLEYERQLKIRKIKKEIERPLIFCVVQGGEYLDLREKCVKELRAVAKKVGRDWDGYGFGARHIDDEGNFLAKVMQATASFIPKKALKFALGVGKPEEIVACVKYGWDMFDCVIPTREGRHGRLFLRKDNAKFKISNDKKLFYETINITNGKYKDDFSGIDKKCDCELCQKHSKSYLHHLFKSKDPLGMRLTAMHNLKFYANLMKEIKTLLKQSPEELLLPIKKQGLTKRKTKKGDC